MKAAALALALALSLLAAPASAACSIGLTVENRGAGALEILPHAWDSGVRMLEGATAPARGPGGFAEWTAATVLEPGETVTQALAAPAGSTCAELRRFQMAYRCLAEDVRGIAFARYPAEGGEPGSVTIPLTRCE